MNASTDTMTETTKNGKSMQDHTHYAKDIILSGPAQATTYGTAGWSIFGASLQEVAAVVAIVFGLLQIGLTIERRWFRKGEKRRKGE